MWRKIWVLMIVTVLNLQRSNESLLFRSALSNPFTTDHMWGMTVQMWRMTPSFKTESLLFFWTKTCKLFTFDNISLKALKTALKSIQKVLQSWFALKSNNVANGSNYLPQLWRTEKYFWTWLVLNCFSFLIHVLKNLECILLASRFISFHIHVQRFGPQNTFPSTTFKAFTIYSSFESRNWDIIGGICNFHRLKLNEVCW